MKNTWEDYLIEALSGLIYFKTISISKIQIQNLQYLLPTNLCLKPYLIYYFTHSTISINIKKGYIGGYASI